MEESKRLTILVSSSVYEYEDLLDMMYTVLTQFGYEVWMSHKGTIPVFSNRSAYENCIAATEKCDLFLGLITPRYGTGDDETKKISITHQELKKAIELKKPRWLLAHDHVVFTRLLLNHLGFKGKSGRDLGFKGKSGRKKLFLEKSPIMEDLRVIDMYEEAITPSQKPPQERKGNWVQKFSSNDDATLFAVAQFSRYQEVEAFLEENFRDSASIVRAIEERTDRS
jgi:hypothetical protein